MAATRLFEAMFQYLSGVAGVTASVGSGTAARIYELYAEQGRSTLYPCIEIEDVSDEVTHQFGAVPTSETRKLTIDCQAVRAQAAQALADAVYVAMIKQEAAIVTVTSWPVRSVHCMERGTPEYFVDIETDTRLFSARLELQIRQDIS